MNQLEAIIDKEKETFYSQRNKDLFSFYTLTLINQEQTSRKLKRNLCLFLLFSMGSLFFLFSPINEMVKYFIVYLSDLTTVDIFILAAFSYGFLFVLITLFRKQTRL